MDTGAHTQRYGEHSRQRLDMATLAFFQNFRKVYVGEQAMHASKVSVCGSPEATEWVGEITRYQGNQLTIRHQVQPQG